MKVLNRYTGAIVVICLLATMLYSCAGASASDATNPDPLRIGLIPNQNPQEVEAQYEPLEAYMSEAIGRDVELEVPTSYNAVVEAMTADRLDLAYFGGLTYVQARERAEVSPLVTEINPRTGDTTYRSLIITPAESPIREVSELRGRTFAFGSASSTSGSLYPAIMLKEAGIDYRRDLGEVTYTGGHDATAQAVANGRVDAGGIEDRILYDLEERGIVEEGAVRSISESDPIEGYPWVVRDAINPELKEQIAEAFLNIEDPQLLDLLRAEGYERVEASDYDYVEEQARDLDLLTERS